MSRAAVKDKRGLSVIIGYVLLIVISIVMSVIVYQWLKTYVPKDIATCPDGTSMFIKVVNYNCTTGVLTVTVANTGRFGIDGYFIRASNKSDEELATIDISSNLITASPEERLVKISGSEIRFSNYENSLSPEDTGNINSNAFNVLSYGRIYKIEVIPARIQEADNQKKLVMCGNVKAEEKLTCN